MQNKEDEASKLILRFLVGLKDLLDSQGFYPARLFDADDQEEIHPEDCNPDNIPKLGILRSLEPAHFSNLIDSSHVPILSIEDGKLGCGLSSLEGTIVPSSIPRFHLLGDWAKWLPQAPICYNDVQILS